LRQETEAILEAEKKKLEEKQDKTQQEVETLEQLKITYKLVDGGKDAWKDIPILLADGQQHSVTSMNNSIANNENGIFEMKKQTQLLMPDKNTFENQAKRLQLLQQEKTNLELQIKEKKQRDHIIAK
jgi:hypothetical protein